MYFCFCLFSFFCFCYNPPVAAQDDLPSSSLAHAPPLCVPSFPRCRLSPRRESVTGLERLDIDGRSLGRPTNLPVGMSVLVAGPQARQLLDNLCPPVLCNRLAPDFSRCFVDRAGLSLAPSRTALEPHLLRRHQVPDGRAVLRAVLGTRHLVCQHAQSPPADGVWRFRQALAALEHDANVLALGVLGGIAVVFHVARLDGVDGVVTAHAAVVAGEPVGAALTEDDVAGDDILFCDTHDPVLARES